MTNEKYRALSVVLTIGLAVCSFNLLGYQKEIESKNSEMIQLTQSIDKSKSVIEEKDKTINELQYQNNELNVEIEELKSRRTNLASRSERFSGGEVFEATAYVDGGNTATGFNLSGHSWESARVIAVDPNVIPLDSQVYIEFDGDFAAYNGIYTAKDTGGAIRGNIIDIFVGDSEYSLAYQFGRRNVRVSVL